MRHSGRKRTRRHHNWRQGKDNQNKTGANVDDNTKIATSLVDFILTIDFHSNTDTNIDSLVIPFNSFWAKSELTRIRVNEKSAGEAKTWLVLSRVVTTVRGVA